MSGLIDELRALSEALDPARGMGPLVRSDRAAVAARTGAARIENLTVQNFTLAEQRAAVLAIHSRREGVSEATMPYTFSWCAECRQVWPCATVAALGADADQPPEEPF